MSFEQALSDALRAYEQETDAHGRPVAVRVPVDPAVLEWFRRHAPQDVARTMAAVLAQYVREHEDEQR